MQKRKLRILMCTEASFLSSGFSTYSKELLSRLYSTNKYKVAEFASYGMVNDPRDISIPWRYYANAVKDTDPRHGEYSSRTDNQFGRWRFDKVLLDFKPDVVIDIRDYWMSAYQALSPLRKLFHWILMPTVDSSPQQEDWIDTFISADAVFTYSDWGAEIIRKQSGNTIKLIDSASPGVNLDIFKIHPNKDKIKQTLGLPQNSIILGSVMRNQKRKLIPELLYSFRKTLDILEQQDPKLGENLFLYLHTSYPDAGWDIPDLLRQERLSNKVFFTYYCPHCSSAQAHIFAHPIRPCPNCHEASFKLPSVTHGLSQEQLSNIYNCFDLYIQYSICEGFGMPQVEAAACGVPIITVDYSAMVDVIEKLGAYAVKPAAKFKELETKAIRVYPDNNELIRHILSFISLPAPMQKQKGLQTRKLTEQHYDWSNIIKKWEKYLDQLDESGYRSDWDQPATWMVPLSDTEMPKSKGDYFKYTANVCAQNIKSVDAMGSMMILSMSKDADYEFTQSGTNIQGFSYKEVVNNLASYINNNNQAEKVRTSKVKFEDDFIQYAHLKDLDKEEA